MEKFLRPKTAHAFFKKATFFSVSGKNQQNTLIMIIITLTMIITTLTIIKIARRLQRRKCPRKRVQRRRFQRRRLQRRSLQRRKFQRRRSRKRRSRKYGIVARKLHMSSRDTS